MLFGIDQSGAFGIDQSSDMVRTLGAKIRTVKFAATIAGAKPGRRDARFIRSRRDGNGG